MRLDIRVAPRSNSLLFLNIFLDCIEGKREREREKLADHCEVFLHDYARTRRGTTKMYCFVANGEDATQVPRHSTDWHTKEWHWAEKYQAPGHDSADRHYAKRHLAKWHLQSDNWQWHLAKWQLAKWQLAKWQLAKWHLAKWHLAKRHWAKQ